MQCNLPFESIIVESSFQNYKLFGNACDRYICMHIAITNLTINIYKLNPFVQRDLPVEYANLSIINSKELWPTALATCIAANLVQPTQTSLV